MTWKRIFAVALVTGATLGAGTRAEPPAETTAPVEAAPATPEVDSTPTAVSPPPPPKKRPKGYREQKENEGTEALRRFEADTILKSQYQLNGQPLEVDPD